MAYNSLNDNTDNQKSLSVKLTPLIDLRDKLHSDLRQASALIAVTSCQDFLDLEKSVICDYLLTLENLIFSALDAYSELDENIDKLRRKN